MINIKNTITFAHMLQIANFFCLNRLQTTAFLISSSCRSNKILLYHHDHHDTLPTTITMIRNRNMIMRRYFSQINNDNNPVINEVNTNNIFQSNNDNLLSNTSYAKKYVMIRKNKQSMAFRNGSPLVYSGSVLKTIQLDNGGNNELNVKNHSLDMGSLVSIIVSNEKDNEDYAKKAKKRGNGKQGKGSNRVTEINYNHLLLDKTNDVVHSYNIDGSLISSEAGIKEIEKEISNGKLIGYGLFNPISMYRVFIFCHQTAHPELFKTIRKTINEGKSEIETTEKVLEMVLHCKIKDAARARMQQGLPSTTTDSYRLVNGEGDGLSGLVVDILGGRVAVIMASAAWCELYRETIMRVIDEILKSEHPVYSKGDGTTLDIVWRNTPMRLKQDGYILEEDEEQESNTNFSTANNESTPVVVTENSIKYNTYPFDTSSQKTGFYCDQRNNRFNLAKYCKDKKVLDLCCYNGGFALNAIMHGGASSCIGVDSSPVAIAAAEENKELNGISSSLSFVKMDIEKYMDEAFKICNEFDVIVLDPPKLAPSINQLDRASRKYHSLNRDAMKLINKKEGGLLLTCTCSGAMTQKNGGQYFLETIQGAALAAGRRITLLSTSGAAPCHVQDPASYPANAYLTAALFSVSPEGE